MHKVVIHNIDTESARKYNKTISTIISSTYSKACLEQVAANAVQLNSDEIIKIPVLLNEFEDLFDATLVKYETEPVDLELNPVYKPFDSKY